MDATIEEARKAGPSSTRPTIVWNTLREFLLVMFALVGGFVLIDLYSHGQSIKGYLLHGALISALIVLVGLTRSRGRARL